MTEDLTPQALRKAYAVPSALALAVEGPLVMAWEDDAEQAVRRVATDPDSLTEAGVGGRAPLGRLEAAGGPVLVRPYRKGGLLRTLRGARFRGRLRPLDELVLHHDLAKAGVPVVEALGSVVRGAPAGWTGSLLVREVVGSVDLEGWLYGGDPQLGPSERLTSAAVLRRAGEAVRALHDAGVEHADLHPKNLLLGPDGVVLVIDLDKARRHPDGLAERERLGNLARFQRAIEKHRRRGMPLDRWQAAAFYGGYAGDPEGATAWRERAQARLGGLTFHKLWWSLTGATRKEVRA